MAEAVARGGREVGLGRGVVGRVGLGRCEVNSGGEWGECVWVGRAEKE